MDGINNDRNVLGRYNPAASRPEKTPATAFGDILAVSVSKITPVLTPAGVAPTASTGNLKDDLNAALRAYGISVPPSLRMTATDKGLELGDNRNARFQAMLNDRPDLRDGLDNLFGSAKASRKTALGEAMAAFGGSHPSAAMTDFLEDFELADKSTALSIKFDGSNMKAEELGEKGWEPVKDKTSFMAELLTAYAKYMVTHQVSSEADKDDPFADLQLKKKLAEVAATS